MYDDDNYDDGFDEEALARRMRLDLWRKLFAYTTALSARARDARVFRDH